MALMRPQTHNEAKFLFTLAIAAAALVGDYIVFKSKFSYSQVFRAISDSLVHASIGFLSALAFFSHEINISTQALVCNVALCTFFSAFIDVDHIFVAKSLLWKDLFSLKQRGIFHCTSFGLVITLMLLLYSYCAKKLNIYLLTWMLVLAYSSHHIRDANRRGLWFYPCGHTPPLSRILYVTLTALLPHVFALLCRNLKPHVYRDRTVEYVIP